MRPAQRARGDGLKRNKRQQVKARARKLKPVPPPPWLDYEPTIKMSQPQHPADR